MADPSAIVYKLLDSESPVTNLRAWLFDAGFVSSEEEYRVLFHEITVRLAKEQISLQLFASGDKQVIQDIEALDTLNDISNLLSERLFEWYSFYHGSIPESGELARDIMEDRQDEIPDAMRSLAKNLADLSESRKLLVAHIQDQMTRVSPNLTNLAGALLAARLLAIAGGLDKLCRMPASRLQVLGANRAMFRHLRGASPPKHGIIFRHPLVHASPRHLRGRIARTLASKLAIAARIDYYSDEVEVREELSQSLNARIEEIKQKQ
ncbi:MAG TPA: ATP-binding protein [Methanosarcinales archaeon]|nr:ATP-binding protein [Methanosarcinales archaeon]